MDIQVFSVRMEVVIVAWPRRASSLCNLLRNGRMGSQGRTQDSVIGQSLDRIKQQDYRTISNLPG